MHNKHKIKVKYKAQCAYIKPVRLYIVQYTFRKPSTGFAPISTDYKTGALLLCKPSLSIKYLR